LTGRAVSIRTAVVFAAALAWSLRAFAVLTSEASLQELSKHSNDLFPPLVSTTNRPVWKGSATVGLTMTRGNSDSVLVTGKIDIERKSALNELILGLDGAYGEADGVKNYEGLHGFVQGNHFFTRRMFVFMRADGLHDRIKDINYRVALSPGAGYYLLRQTNLNFAIEAGPSVIFEKQDGLETIYAGWRLADRFEYRVNGTTRIWQTAEFIPQVDRFANFIINAEVGIETAITKKLGLQVYIQDNYVNQPAPGFKLNDVRLVSGVSYKF
jgi:putative salt-induced outer membrane protein YdiY